MACRQDAAAISSQSPKAAGCGYFGLAHCWRY